jgi:hypothetical protein
MAAEQDIKHGCEHNVRSGSGRRYHNFETLVLNLLLDSSLALSAIVPFSIYTNLLPSK